MKIVINHDNCQHGGYFSDHCLSATIRNPLGHERFCMAEMEEDGRPELTIVLKEGGEERTIILHNEREQMEAAAQGWLAFYRE